MIDRVVLSVLLLACACDSVSELGVERGEPPADQPSVDRAAVEPRAVFDDRSESAELVVPKAPFDPDAPPPIAVTTRVITQTHRYVPGAMFGGWGPHLGHLVRAPDGTLFWIDDACDQGGGAGACNVNVNHRLEYHALIDGAWQLRTTSALPPGIQQNTGTILDGDSFASFGVDTGSQQIIECRLNASTLRGSCAPIVAASLPPYTNYVGAAISTSGYPVAWATSVGSGGTFHWFVDYGGGWNGPRTGFVGGYNDASYVNIAFDADRFVLHAELVLGQAPNWTFQAAFADGDAASGNAVQFAILGAANGDALVSTNDVIIDPLTGDTHLLARTNAGAIAYVYRPRGGAFGAPMIVVEQALRARWVLLANGVLVMAYGKNGSGLHYRLFRAGERIGGAPLPFAAAPEVFVELPSGYENIYAIYPESAVYQRALPNTFNIALVGAERQHEALHVAIEGL